MTDATSSSVSKTKRPVPPGEPPAGRRLRTGKIYTTKASATEIRRAVGVTAADELVAAKALRGAEAKTQSRLTVLAKK